MSDLAAAVLTQTGWIVCAPIGIWLLISLFLHPTLGASGDRGHLAGEFLREFAVQQEFLQGNIAIAIRPRFVHDEGLPDCVSELPSRARCCSLSQASSYGGTPD